MTLARKLAGLSEELRADSPVGETLFRLARRTTHSLRLSPALSIERGVRRHWLLPRKSDLALPPAGV